MVLDLLDCLFLFFYFCKFFFYLQIWIVFREPNKRERVFLLCLPSFENFALIMYMKNDETNLILTWFLIFFFYVLCEEEEREERGERHKI